MSSNAEQFISSKEQSQSTQKHPLEDMPSFEEHMRQMEAAKAQPKRINIASNGVSSIYKVEKSDGKIDTVIESPYFEMANKFTSEHNVFKKDFELCIAMDGMSMDLAMIDATSGKKFQSYDEKLQSSFLKNYGMLKTKLDDPNTPPEDKQLITDYFDTMKGDALTFLANHYDPDKQAKQQEENEKQKRAEQLISNTKEQLKRAKTAFLEDSTTLDQALSYINELIASKSTDVDELHSSLHKLLQAQESLEYSTSKFYGINENFIADLAKNREQIGDNLYKQEFSTADNNNEEIHQSYKKIYNTDERIVQIRKYIAAAEDFLGSMRKF